MFPHPAFNSSPRVYRTIYQPLAGEDTLFTHSSPFLDFLHLYRPEFGWLIFFGEDTTTGEDKGEGSAFTHNTLIHNTIQAQVKTWRHQAQTTGENKP